MKLINLTPHSINVVQADGTAFRSVPPSGTLARCAVSRRQVGDVDGIPVNTTSFGAVEGLPPPQVDTLYIVSALVAQALPHRTDLLIPDDAVRDEKGRVIGCRALATIAGQVAPGPRDLGSPVKSFQNDELEDSVLADAMLAKLPGLLRDSATPTPLADVAGSHGCVLRELPPGVCVESDTYVIKGGYNGKRPLYLVAGAGVYALAAGTYFGRQSTFALCTTAWDIARHADEILSAAEITRALADRGGCR